jgi:glycine/D-amino acid oxidase-like deaminating enzyme
MMAMGLTRKRDLRSGAAVWSADRIPPIIGTPLRRSLQTDVLIVGGGITGALLAHSLVKAGLRPLIVDRRRAALLGSTAASTALLQFELDTPLITLSKSIGARKAANVWRASRNAVNELRTRTHALGFDAQLVSRPSLYLAGDVLDARALKREASMRQRIGLASELLDGRALRHHFGIHREAAILSHGNAEANPVQLADRYLRSAIKGGARFHAPHEIVDLQYARYGTTLRTADGIDIRARYVVLCTGYELAKIVPPANNRVMSTWAIATRPQPLKVWPQRALIWESSDPYLYLRTTRDGRVICGGEDEEFADSDKRDALLPHKAMRIGKKLHSMFPALDVRPAFKWAGSFGASPNGMPTIGEIPGYPKCYAVMGYGGNGITFSMLATQIITSAIQGKANIDAPLFRFK